jgi:hypothetical protein
VLPGIFRDVLPGILLLALAPTAVLAQPLVCHAIRRGESATQAAQRITGDSRNTYRASFQIMNASSRFIPKSQYDRIRAGWRACVIRPAIVRASSNAARITAPDAPDASKASSVSAPREVLTASAVPEAPTALATAPVAAGGDGPLTVASDLPPTIEIVDLTMVWLGAAMVVPWFGWRILDRYLVRWKTAWIVMQHFASRFVSEFERPLVHDAAERPLRSRLRCSPQRGRIDILLAPGEGRRYPNLSDHKKNVEYDVARVIQALADDSFVSGRLYMQDEWVVVPLQFLVRRSLDEGGRTGPKSTGVTCISSF